jgi:hypothetical protein
MKNIYRIELSCGAFIYIALKGAKELKEYINSLESKGQIPCGFTLYGVLHDT